jgi:LysR family transcriptional regulator, glycine cleavage system transcriptional activator
MRPEVKIFNDWLIADVLAEIAAISAMMPAHK